MVPAVSSVKVPSGATGLGNLTLIKDGIRAGIGIEGTVRIRGGVVLIIHS